MPAIGTINIAQKRNRTGDTNGAQPVRKGLPMAIYATASALNRLERAAEKPAEILETIEVLTGIRKDLEKLELQPTITSLDRRIVLQNFGVVHELLRQAGLESGGLHDALYTAENAVKQAGQREPVTA